MTIFDEATAVRRVAEGRYEAQPDPRFALVAPGGTAPPAVNGGVLVATVLRAVLDTSPHPYPVATSAHFLRVPLLEPAEVEVTWLKQGRTAATARAALVQDGQTGAGHHRDHREPACGPGRQRGAELDRRAAAAAAARGVRRPRAVAGDRRPGRDRGLRRPGGHAAGPGHHGLAARPSRAGVPEMRGYFGLRDERDPDAYLLALAVDGLPPVVFGLGATGWSPTVELHLVHAGGPGARTAAGRDPVPARQRRLVRRGGRGLGRGGPAGGAEPPAGRVGRGPAPAATRRPSLAPRPTARS